MASNVSGPTFPIALSTKLVFTCSVLFPILLFNFSFSLLSLIITVLELESLCLLVLTTGSDISISMSFSAAFLATSSANLAAIAADSVLVGGVPLGAGVFRALDSEDWGGVGVLSGFSLLMSSRMFFPVLGSKMASGFFSLCGA